MADPRIAIVTMTRAASDEEARRISEGLTVAGSFGVPVFVTDQEGQSGLVPGVESLPNLVLASAASEMVARVCSTFQRAIEKNAEVCVYTEPDKIPFFRSGLDRFLQAVQQNPKALVIAARNDAAFATVPAGQRKLESMENEIAAAFLGHRTDYFFGPFAIPRGAVERYLPDVHSLGWGWRTYIMARCILDGMPVVVVDGPFDAPEWNRGEDDADSRLYRLKQFVESVEGFRQALIAVRR